MTAVRDHDGRFRGRNFAFGFFYPGYDYGYDYGYGDDCYQAPAGAYPLRLALAAVWVCSLSPVHRRMRLGSRVFGRSDPPGDPWRCTQASTRPRAPHSNTASRRRR